jgi:hypothetical protein
VERLALGVGGLVIVVALGLTQVLAYDEGPSTGPRLDPEVQVGHVRPRPIPLVRRPDLQPWEEWERTP